MSLTPLHIIVLKYLFKYPFSCISQLESFVDYSIIMHLVELNLLTVSPYRFTKVVDEVKTFINFKL